MQQETDNIGGGDSFAYNMWQIGLSPGTTRRWPAPLGRAARGRLRTRLNRVENCWEHGRLLDTRRTGDAIPNPLNYSPVGK